MRFLAALCCALVVQINSLMAQAEHVDLALPTDNDALFRGGGEEFYQYIERDYKGQKSKPWEGGQYGFVRNPVETPAGIIYSRFHEGIDIKPLRRDARGEPLDEVRAIAPGKVAYTNHTQGASNYGRYVVIEHIWGGAPYYSLYGHLRSIAVEPGRRVGRSEVIGGLGYSGAGLNQARAHLHLELNLMLSRNFEPWHSEFYKSEENRNGIYNGINLTGINIARLYLELRKRPSLSIPEFLSEEEVFFRIGVRNSPHFYLPKLYPWIGGASGEDRPPSWEVSFTRAGIPVKLQRSTREVAGPMLTFIKPSAVDCYDLTRGLVTGRGENARLTDRGKRLARLLTYPD